MQFLGKLGNTFKEVQRLGNIRMAEKRLLDNVVRDKMRTANQARINFNNTLKQERMLQRNPLRAYADEKVREAGLLKVSQMEDGFVKDLARDVLINTENPSKFITYNRLRNVTGDIVNQQGNVLTQEAINNSDVIQRIAGGAAALTLAGAAGASYLSNQDQQQLQQSEQYQPQQDQIDQEDQQDYDPYISNELNDYIRKQNQQL